MKQGTIESGDTIRLPDNGETGVVDRVDGDDLFVRFERYDKDFRYHRDSVNLVRKNSTPDEEEGDDDE